MPRPGIISKRASPDLKSTSVGTLLPSLSLTLVREIFRLYEKFSTLMPGVILICSLKKSRFWTNAENAFPVRISSSRITPLLEFPLAPFIRCSCACSKCTLIPASSSLRTPFRLKSNFKRGSIPATSKVRFRFPVLFSTMIWVPSSE